MLKKSTSFALLMLLFVGIISLSSSCKTAEGCQLEEKYQAKTDKNGNLSTQKGRSNLWSKKQRKKMKSRK